MYTQESKQTNMHTCVSVNVCGGGTRANQRHTRPQLEGVRVISECMRARVCWDYCVHLSTVSVCLPVHTVTHTHTHTQATRKTQANTCQFMIENQHFHSNTVRSTQPRETRTLTEALKARRKRRVAGPTTGCCWNEAACDEENQRVRQPDVRYAQQNKQKNKKKIPTQTYKYTCWNLRLYEEREWIRVGQPAVRYFQKEKNMHLCVSVYVYVYTERERISVTDQSHSSPPQLKGVRVISSCVCAHVCAGTISLIYVCIYIHTHTYICMYMCMRSESESA